MAAKGSQAKAEVLAKLQEVFPNGFTYEKVFVVPCVEDNQRIDIKIALTAAKNPIEQGGDVAIPGAQAPTVSASINEKTPIEPTAEEKKNISDFLSSMGF